MREEKPTETIDQLAGIIIFATQQVWAAPIVNGQHTKAYSKEKIQKQVRRWTSPLKFPFSEDMLEMNKHGISTYTIG